MKKAISLILVTMLFAVAFGTAGCGKKGPPQPPDERLYETGK